MKNLINIKNILVRIWILLICAFTIHLMMKVPAEWKSIEYQANNAANERAFKHIDSLYLHKHGWDWEKWKQIQRNIALSKCNDAYIKDNPIDFDGIDNKIGTSGNWAETLKQSNEISRLKSQASRYCYNNAGSTQWDDNIIFSKEERNAMRFHTVWPIWSFELSFLLLTGFFYFFAFFLSSFLAIVILPLWLLCGREAFFLTQNEIMRIKKLLK